MGYGRMMDPEAGAARSPLTLTASPRLDAALAAGPEAWVAAMRAAGAPAAGSWLALRAGDSELAEAASDLVRGLLEAEDADARAEAWIGLAELGEELEDPLLADTSWEGALAAGRDGGNGDVVAAATAKLAAIAEQHGDPLAAAEYFIDFLNWRRQPGHVSDADEVETAFDEIIRLATRDGARKEAALYEYRQVAYTRLLEADDDRAVEGDWEATAAPYESWE
jgi:hypothetical protein